jgi:hypothetical protein
VSTTLAAALAIGALSICNLALALGVATLAAFVMDLRPSAALI